VDTYNVVMDDQAIVYTDSWVSRYYGGAPGFNMIDAATTIGQVANLQIGKLLGLLDVNNPGDTMDFITSTGGTAAPSAFLLPRTFQSSMLDSSIWPFGFQNSPALLLEILGDSPPEVP
jgi:hypothetical protein